MKSGWGEVIKAYSENTPGMAENIVTLGYLTEAVANPFMRSVHYVLPRPAEVDPTARAA